MRAWATPGNALLATLRQIVDLATTLPAGAEMTLAWEPASADLVLALAQQDGAELRAATDGSNEVEWRCGALTIRARCGAAPRGRPTLMLVR